jgi:hypothetical protein
LRCASVSVGIVDYDDPYYVGSQMRLRHAVTDAEAFRHYMSLAWPSGETQHLLIANRQAVYGGLESAIAAAAGDGFLDLFVLYLSGHGDLGEDGLGWFCLCDAKPGTASLDCAALDRCLRPITADSVIVFIDCCHAEAVVSDCSSFISAKSRRARIVAASCRADQRAWEDDGLKRSIFSDVLLRALSTDSPVADAQGQVDLQAQLLPYLRDQIPVAASALKQGNEQDPVTVGLLGGSLMLPVISSRSLGRPLTISQAIRAGVRRFMLTAIGVVAILFAMTDLLIFHLAVDSTGEIIVRPGFSSTYGVVPVHLLGNLDTGISIRQVSSTNDRILAALAAESIWGVATHRDTHGLRPWFGLLQPGLVGSVGQPLRALAFGEYPKLDIDRDSPPAVETLFLAQLRAGNPSAIGHVIYPYDPSVPWACTDQVINQVDFTRLSASPDVLGRDVEWVAVTAPDDPNARAIMLADIVKLVAYRFVHEKDKDKRLAQFDAFATAIERFAALEPSDAFQSASASFLNQATGTWCDLHATFASLIVGSRQQSLAAESALRKVLETYDRNKQADDASVEQSFAVRGLSRGARHRPLDPTTLQAIEAMLARDGSDVTAITPEMELLTAIATSQELPAGLVNLLWNNLRPESGPGDFAPLISTNLLARNFKFLNSDQRNKFRQWLAAQAPSNVTMSDFHEALGFVALVEPITRDQLDLLEKQLSSISRFPPQATNYRGETVVTASGDKAAIALGRVAQSSSLSAEITERLANFAAARTELPGREEIIRGLGRQWLAGAPNLTEVIKNRFNVSSKDAHRRSLEVEVAALVLMHLPASKRARALEALVSAWQKEIEPVQRIALAKLIGSACALRTAE